MYGSNGENVPVKSGRGYLSQPKTDNAGNNENSQIFDTVAVY